jgi:hypothetical protein
MTGLQYQRFHAIMFQVTMMSSILDRKRTENLMVLDTRDLIYYLLPKDADEENLKPFQKACSGIGTNWGKRHSYHPALFQ